MKKLAKETVTIIRRTLGYGLLVTIASLVSIAVYVLNQRSDLSIWHEVDLDEEFEAKSDVTDFAGYLELEDRLFAQLEEEVYQQLPPGNARSINRYQKGSMVDPTSMSTNWNRSFELKQAEPTAGVLLLHGLSDSPYSLKTLGESLHASGASVIGLRIPGHGTAPSGLVEITWKDWAAAVKIAAKHLKGSIGDKPLYLVGYSNGGALSVVYALQSLNDESLPIPDGLVLLSPEIGISRAAGLAVWQGRIGHWLGLEKLAWNSISVEYDPFKYGSFAVNAGDQAYRITAEIDKQLDKMSKAGALANFPKTLAFQSAVDATVSAPALVTRVFERLPKNGHELVLFDINRVELIEHLLSKDPADDLDKLLNGPQRNFALSVVTNAPDNGSATFDVQIKHRAAGQSEITSESTDMSWPDEVFSLSHVALPFPESDPLYGTGDGGKTPTLGNRALRGERGTLLISPNDMLRQKWNPFYPWLEKHSLEFINLVPKVRPAP
ncbi:alpha/beta hydrolase [Haloferula chungangensis]|uniref:Alpha/beta hydrolase n=1 Tax=Haloferula chungangensis TaxID=1048331 RepID=A0ABW2L297_9BACT